MSEHRTRLAITTSAVLMTVLFLAELVTWNNPQLSDSASRLREIFVAGKTESSISLVLAALTTISVLCFAAGLRDLVRRTTGSDTVASLVLSGSASVFAAAQITFVALSGALIVGAPTATDHELTLLLGPLTYMDAARFMPFAVMVGAAALATAHARLFRTWITWVGYGS
jgi:hypothetical protein